MQVVQSAGVFLAGCHWLTETGLAAGKAVPLADVSPGYLHINTSYEMIASRTDVAGEKLNSYRYVNLIVMF